MVTTAVPLTEPTTVLLAKPHYRYLWMFLVFLFYYLNLFSNIHVLKEIKQTTQSEILGIIGKYVVNRYSINEWYLIKGFALVFWPLAWHHAAFQ